MNKFIKDTERTYYTMAESNSFSEGFRYNIVCAIKDIGPESILEVGCGTGELCTHLPKSVRYIGVDVSEHAVKKAQKRFTGNFQFEHIGMNAKKFRFPDEEFDVVVGIYSLEHFLHPKEYLEEMIRVLKVGGTLIILAPNLEFPFAIPNAIRHKSLVYKSFFVLLRILDYVKRIVGIWTFRTIKDNYMDETGKYEKPDDDLRYVVSSYEVINFLLGKGMNIISMSDRNYGSGLKGALRRAVGLLPAMRYYGGVLFLVMKKHA